MPGKCPWAKRPAVGPPELRPIYCPECPPAGHPGRMRGSQLPLGLAAALPFPGSRSPRRYRRYAPTRLKAIGDTPRRLIPTNGQTIAAVIHTADEAPPWRGLPLAWHLGRLISVALTALAVTLTYAIAWRLTGQRILAASAAALHAFIPQVLFIGSVLNDDTLLICLSGLILLTLVTYPRHSILLMPSFLEPCLV